MTAPDPLVPADVDLRDFAFMPLDVVRLRDSGLTAKASGDEFRAAVLLWCASWHQQPAASLPNDDEELANLCGYSRAMREWHKIKKGAMRGWIECSDGRLYHPMVAIKARDAWESKLAQRARTEAARKAREAKRQTQSQGLSQTTEISVTKNVTASKGQGQGQGYKEEHPIPPQGADPDGKEPTRPKTTAVGLKAWLETVKAKGEKPIPPDDPVFAYASEVGIPDEFLTLAWLEFRHRYCQPDAKRYRDWRSVFRKAVRGNWLRLWFAQPDGAYALTTVGIQAQRSHEDRKAA